MGERPSSEGSDAGVFPSRSFEFVSPIFLMTANHPSIMPNPRPATADAELDLADLPVVGLRYVISEALLGGTGYEFAPAVYLRYQREDRLFEMTYWDEGEEKDRTATIDPREREEEASIDIDEALDDLGYLDRDNPAAPARALELTFGVLNGWFKPNPITVDSLLDWESGFVLAELERRGVWAEGPAPWSR